MSEDEFIAPNEFYRKLRPNNFSDSSEESEAVMTEEVAKFELSKITTDCKTEEFETLCRKLSERFITPNLIPQTWPTWWWDWKTDSETHPVSSDISIRYFVPENWRSNDENRAFAISASEDRRGKVRKDVKSIVSTGRWYTQVHYLTNQTPSSKKKKDAQDSLSKEFWVKVIIYDRVWLVEKIFTKWTMNIFIESLNLNRGHKILEIPWSNDIERKKILEELEENLLDQNRYVPWDYQLTEDSLTAAIYSRMLELPKDIVIGKFDRAKRLSKETNLPRQLIRVYYESAFTKINYLWEIDLFLKDYIEFKKLVIQSDSMFDLEYRCTLVTLLKVVEVKYLDEMNSNWLEFEVEEKQLIKKLSEIEKNNSVTQSSLAEANKIFLNLHSYLKANDTASISKSLIRLNEIISSVNNFLDFPFQSIVDRIGVFEMLVWEYKEYDSLIDTIADVASKRSSSKKSAVILSDRWDQKLDQGKNKQAIIYYWRSVVKLAKLETRSHMISTISMLWIAYRNMWLLWASSQCLIFSLHLLMKDLVEDEDSYRLSITVLEETIRSQLLIWNISTLLMYFELYNILLNKTKLIEDKRVAEFSVFLDGCLAVRLCHADIEEIEEMDDVPDLFNNAWLSLSRWTLLYMMGHKDLVLEELWNDFWFKDIKDLQDFFDKLFNQPFANQTFYKTDFLTSWKLKYETKIMWCKICLSCNNDSKENILLIETLLWIIESFFATIIDDAMPIREDFDIQCIFNATENGLKVNHSAWSMIIEINHSLVDSEGLWNYHDNIFYFLTVILTECFFLKDKELYLKRLFSEEEVLERINVMYSHYKIVQSIFWNVIKNRKSDWVTDDLVSYDVIKDEFPSFIEDVREWEDINDQDVNHQSYTVNNLIDLNLWDWTVWNAFGFFAMKNRSWVMKHWIMLMFNDLDIWIKIFEWRISTLWRYDKENKLRIVVLKGIDSKNPYHYRVVIWSNMDIADNWKRQVLIVRKLTMTPKDHKNLNHIQSVIGNDEFMLCPAFEKDWKYSPGTSVWIIKNELIIKNAREVWLNDIDRVWINKWDDPIIPEDITNPPITEVMEHLWSL